MAPAPDPDDIDMTWEEAVASYRDNAGDYPSYVGERPYFAWLKVRIGDLSVRAIDNAKLAELIAERRKKRRFDRPNLGRISNAAVNNSVTHMIQKVLRHAKVRGVSLRREPHYKDHLLSVAPREREMVIDEEMILEGIRPDVWPYVRFVLETGLRKRASLIEKKQVHWRQGVIHVVGKGGKFQQVEITPEVAEILKAEWHKHPTHVFTFRMTRDGRHPVTKQMRIEGECVPLSYNSITEIWRNICDRAGVTDLRIHDIRKTTGARIVRTTGDLKAASKVLNHSDISTTARHYAYITTDDIRRRLAQTAAETRRLRDAWTPGPNDGSEPHPG
ncbi:tyrosine-type recombinase/integrase [Methylobacterium sp. WL69]|uniref:tyrosine-type recombinase/integrase n=1 Tax=Methylobacterium sp. WL69 TaxID=2603893 RepID=UPI0016501A2B|nr:tyrosine-type recombinase/integrase [Methylobacterium sp. WL69]